MRHVLAAVAHAAVLASLALGPAVAATAAPAVTQPPRPTAWLGVSLSTEVPPDRSDAVAGEASEAAGVRIEGIVDGSPAEEAGLRESDRILSIEDTPVRSPGDLIAAVRTLDPDSWVALEVQRGKTEMNVRVRLSSRSADGSGYRLRSGSIGVRGIDLPPSLRSFFGAPERAGILVSEVEAGSTAEDAGIEIGDVVFSAGGVPVRSAGEFDRVVTRAGVDNKVEIHLMRYGAEITVEPVVARRSLEKPGS